MAIEPKDAERKSRAGEEMFQAVFMAMDEGAVLQDGRGGIVAVNPAAENILGLAAMELMGRSSADFAQALGLVDEDEAPLRWQLHPAMLALETGKSRRNVQMGVRRPDGALVWISVSAQPLVSDGAAGPYGVVTTFRDITESRLARKYEQFRTRMLELLSGDTSLRDVLEGVARGVEQLRPELICGILLVDSQGKRFRKGIGPSLPDFFNAAIEGLEIGIGIGSCGTAAATGERVIVEDIQTHPHWAPYKELATRAGLGACWSEPIRSSTGQVLGTFAAYRREARSPAEFDLSIIEKTVRLVSIAIERRQAEDALRASELEFRTLAENLPDALVRYDREGRRTYVSSRWERECSVPAGEVLGKTLREVNPTGMLTLDVYRRALEHTLATGERSELELQKAVPGGNMRTHQCFIVAERAADGRVCGAIAISREITELKRMEDEIRRREREFRTLVENSPDPVFRYDRDCRRLFVHLGNLRGNGESVESMLGSTPDDGSILKAEAARKLIAGIRQVFDSGVVITVHPDFVGDYGCHWDYLIHLVPELDEHGNVATVLGLYRDITAIRNAERQMTQFVANLPGFAFTFELSPEGHRGFPFVSPGFEKLFGLKPEDLKDDIAPLLAVTHPDDLPRVLAAIDESVRTMAPFRMETRASRPGMPPRWGELRAVPVRQADGSVLWHGIMLDIDRRKRDEAELERHRHHLEKLVEERTRALSVAKEAAEAATRAKSHFLAAASHDLRQPLQAIRLFNDVLAASGLNEQQRKIYRSLSKSVNSLSELFNDLLDLSRLDAGIIQPRPVAIQADELMGMIGAEFDAVFHERRLRLNLFWPQRGLTLFSDGNLLQTMLRNLISNAVKYTPRGGVLVAIRRRGDRALIQVWDTGIGIAKEQMEAVFEEYFQIGNPERDRTKGVGLGLAIVRRLSRLLDIEVRLRSRVGKGSVFELSVPLANAPDTYALPINIPASLGALTSARFAGRRVVVIEDDATAGAAFKLALEMDDMDVALFRTAEEALGSPEIRGADYYISDYRLPGMDGLQLLDAIQSSSAEPIKAVVLTGSTSPDQIALLQSHRWKVLVKPIGMPQLLSALDAHEAVC